MVCESNGVLVMLKFLNQDFNDAHKGKRYVPYIYKKAIEPAAFEEEQEASKSADAGKDEKKS